MFQKNSMDEIRGIASHHIYTLEFWLKHVIHSELIKRFGENYLGNLIASGSLSAAKTQLIIDRKDANIARYKRYADAFFFPELIYILCHPNLHKPIFRDYFKVACPYGEDELRNLLNKLVDPRNRLSHANPITHRQAEQVVCYSNDLIDSIKEHYKVTKQHMMFNVPRIIRFRDSFGNDITFTKDDHNAHVNLIGQEKYYLRPGDSLKIELEIDNSFERDEYVFKWSSKSSNLHEQGDTNKISLKIEESHISQEYRIECKVISKKSWHRLKGDHDDLLVAFYTVLPDLSV